MKTRVVQEFDTEEEGINYALAVKAAGLPAPQIFVEAIYLPQVVDTEVILTP